MKKNTNKIDYNPIQRTLKHRHLAVIIVFHNILLYYYYTNIH